MDVRKILSVVDEQTASTVVARYAMALAAVGGSELVLYAARGEGNGVTCRAITQALDVRHCVTGTVMLPCAHEIHPADPFQGI